MPANIAMALARRAIIIAAVGPRFGLRREHVRMRPTKGFSVEMRPDVDCAASYAAICPSEPGFRHGQFLAPPRHLPLPPYIYAGALSEGCYAHVLSAG